jgi:glycine/D-amino acid oxidase-like deaminating enzyme
MKRLWEPEAYGPGPLSGCWWAETVPAHDWPALQSDLSTDVAIIGGGFTGLSAALHLAEAGVEATVIEAEHPYWGASGRNGGFCCLGGSKASDATLRRRFGDEGLREWRQTEKSAVELVGSLLDRLGIDADRHSDGETQLAHRPKDFVAMQAAARALPATYGVTPTLIPPEAMADHGMKGPFHGALTIPTGFALNPRKYAHGLAMAAQAAGARICAHTRVERIEGTGPYRLRTPNGTVSAKRLVIATNGYSSDDVPDWLAGRTMPVQSSVLVTRQMTAEEIAAQGWSSLQMCYDTRKLLHYFRLMPNGRMLFGMRGGLAQTPAAVAANKAQIRASFETMFPAWRGVETPHYWSGLICLARNLTPYVGPIDGMPGAFAGFAYHGNGVGMGSYAGKLLAALVQGRAPEGPYAPALKAQPGRFPFGMARRAIMRPVYAGYALRDL